MLEGTHSAPSSSNMIATYENWQDSLNNLERELAAYRHATSNGATEEELASAAERVSAAVQRAQGAPMDSLSKRSSTDLPPTYQPSTPSEPSQFFASWPSLNKLRREVRTQQPVIVELERTSNDLPPVDASSSKSDNPAVHMGRGVLILMATPIAAAGMCLYASGLLVEGMAMIFKGMGSAGKKPLERVMTGKHKSRKFRF